MAREIGPTMETVRHNFVRLLGERKVSMRALAAEMPDGPGRLTHSALSEIARGIRRVDVDELTALAVALGISPITLLMPYDEDGYNDDNLVQLTGTEAVFGADLLRWLRGEAPLDLARRADLDDFEAEAFRRRSLPIWARGWWKRDEKTTA
ncbi:helix-turn-helix domain-containing protein [Mycobacteroides abscessus]|uniref:helix-turn-helix domain-containing protein n=1 Tax=Mycobacteroides abscessus TaxID=36809 RepID=UPI0009A5EDA6|nr:helix-turn-helix transcriptional regulator [Mycobacteroides abscessus]